MPAENIYRIKEGDTLSDLFGQNWQEVAAFNGIDDPTKLQVGQEIDLNLYEPQPAQQQVQQEEVSGEEGFLSGAADWASSYFKEVGADTRDVYENLSSSMSSFGNDVYSSFGNSPIGTLEDYKDVTVGDWAEETPVETPVVPASVEQAPIAITIGQTTDPVGSLLNEDTTPSSLYSAKSFSSYDVINNAVQEEGGYVNDPNDPGGVTKFGVTLRDNAPLLEKLGIKTAEDMKSLTREQAMRVYRENYWGKSQANLLPKEAQDAYFSSYINVPKHAVKALQKIVGASEDGDMGPKTIDKIKEFQDGGGVIEGSEIRRNQVYNIFNNRRLGEANKRTNANGWLNRYLLTDKFGAGLGKVDKRETSNEDILRVIKDWNY